MSDPSSQQHKIMRFLTIDKGYPDWSIRWNDTSLREGKPAIPADIAIYDYGIPGYLALIQLKQNVDESVRRKTRDAFSAWNSALPKTFLYLFDISGTDITIWRYDENNLREISKEQFPPRNVLQLLYYQRFEDQRQRAVDDLKKPSLIASCVVIVMLIFQLFLRLCFRIALFDTISLSLLTLAIALMLLPYAAKIKFPGFEFERKWPHEKHVEPHQPDD